MIISYQISFTVSIELSGQIMEFIASLGTVADVTQTVLPDDNVRTDLILLTFVS